ncbi:MAG: type II toxin-antitoxin system VapC family toxin [Methanomicrobiales archaeon]|nr:type II toxin-antitoxin system VapC family toxin [Methanomicrobiales archaeon]
MREQDWEIVGELFTPDSDLFGVGMLITESTNVIWKHVTKYGDREEQGWTMFSAMEKLFQANIVNIEPDIKYLKEALQIGVKFQLPVYESLFLAQAQHYDTTLVTCDKKQAKIAGELSIQVDLT